MAADLRLQVLFDAVDKLTKPLKNIGRGSGAAAKKMAEAQKQLKAIKQEQKDIRSFVNLRKQVESNSSAFHEKRAKVRALRQEISKTENPTKSLTNNFMRGAKSSATLRRRLRGQLNTMKQLRGSINSASTDTASLTKRTKQLDEQHKSLNKTISQQKKILASTRRPGRNRAGHGPSRMSMGMHGAGAYYAGRSGLQSLAGMMEAGVNFESTMSKVQALSRLDKNSAEMKALRNQARELGASTSFSAVQTAGAQAFLAMAGFDAKSIQQALPGLLDMSKAGGSDLGRGADIASNILGAFKIEPKEMGKVADILTKAFTTSNTSLEMLANTMEYVGPVAQAAGMDLETTAAMAGLLGNVGIQSQKSGTTLRAMLLRLSAPTGAASTAMEELGLKTKDADGNVRNMVEILSDVAKATEKMGSGKRLQYLKDIFGEEPAAGMAELIDQAGSNGISKYLAVIKNHHGAARKTATIMGDNLRGLITEFQSATADLRITLFDSQSGALSGLLKNITDIVRGISGWVQENPKLTSTLFKIAAVLLVILTLGGGLLAMVATFGMIATGIAAISAPVLALIGTIALLGLAAGMVYTRWKGIKGGAVALWTDISTAVTDHLQRMKGGAVALWDDIKALPGRFRDLGIDMIKGLVNGVTNTIGLVKNAITNVGTQTIGWFKDKLGIRSPSRVFAALGDNTMTGLALGIDRSQMTPLTSIKNMSKKLAANGALAASISATPAAAITQGSATTAPVGDTISIYITAPAGTDTQALAALVRDTLDERDRQKAARGRSALYDTD